MFMVALFSLPEGIERAERKFSQGRGGFDLRY
jgi:hypothetical protein